MRRTHGSLIKILRILFSVLVLCLSLLFLLELYSMRLLTSQLLIIAAVVIFIIDAMVIAGLLFFSRRRGVQVLCSMLVVALCAVYGVGSWYMTRTGDALRALTSNNEQVKNVINIYALKDSGITSVEDLKDKDVGVLTKINKAGTEKCLEDLTKQGIYVDAEDFSNFGPLANALYEKDVDAIIVNQIYLSNITDLEAFTNFLDETQVVYQYTYYTDISYNTAKVSDITTIPFTVMINGSDSRGGLGDTDRSDVNMLATINPKTNIVLLVSIPRDAYVETACDPEYDCLEGQFDKLTHTGLHTYHTTQKTIENLMDIDINYVFRANFTSVVDIVDALGGIDVNVAPGYAVPYFYTNDMFGTDYGVHEGINHLNGQAALLYARERYGYTEGDFQRIKNQQEVLTQIAKKITSPDIITKYTSLLQTIDGNFWTDISTREITDFIQHQIHDMPDWTFISYSLSGESDALYCAEAYNTASVIVLDQNTVKTAKELIEAVKDGKTAEEINQMIEEAADLPADYTLKSSDVPQVDTSSEDYYAPVEDVQPQIPSYDGGINDPVFYPEQQPVAPDYSQTPADPGATTTPDYSDPGYTPQPPAYQDPGYVDPGYTTQPPVYQDPGYVGGYGDYTEGYSFNQSTPAPQTIPDVSAIQPSADAAAGQ